LILQKQNYVYRSKGRMRGLKISHAHEQEDLLFSWKKKRLSLEYFNPKSIIKAINRN
jgi:hypothetical protein